MTNRAERRRIARADKPVRQGLTAGQLQEAEAEMAEGAVEHQSSYATTLAVLAHSWFALDHQRESARVTYQRTLELRKGGREMKTDGVVQQYAEAKAEITIVEDQIKRLLDIVAEQEGDDVAVALLETTHMNMMNGIGVRFPEATRDRFAVEAGIKDPPEGAETPSGDPESTGNTDPEG